MSTELKPIAYIAQNFPNLTATFIYREVFALREIGFKVITLSNRDPDVRQLSAEARALVDTTTYVFPIAWPAMLLAHFYYLLTRPLKYLGTLFFVLTRPGESSQNRLRTLLHFGGAIFLAREVQRQQVQHIHAHFSVNAATMALVIARLLGISFSFTAHNNFYTDRLILKEKLREARFIVAISEHARDYLLDLVPGENLRDKFHIVHCGISLEKFSPPAHKPFNRPPLIFTVSQLVERKGYPVLVEACRILTERGVPYRCLIGGDGPQRALLQQMIDQYQLQAQVQLPGVIFQEQLVDHLSQADLFVLPCLTAANGDRDGVPVSLMEAMAMALPVVSTYVSGVPELIEEGHSGLLVPEKDAQALANAIQRLLEDEALRLKLGRQAQQKVAADFDLDRTSKQLAELFRQSLAERNLVTERSSVVV
jgi:colanic acid/amylovoran biosynthesis glycosyltransferase